jgi:hypothetical protein
MNSSQCKDCRSLVMNPEALEAAIPGLKILSSGYGSVRGETGLCRRHDQFVTASSTCADFEGKAKIVRELAMTTRTGLQIRLNRPPKKHPGFA